MFIIDSGVKFDIEGQAYVVGVPIHIWLPDITHIENGALIQLIQASNLPCAFHHVSAMPDVHQGYGLPIGGVLALSGCVSPYSVGSDIGCGMCAVMTNIPLGDVSRDQIIDLRRHIRKVIPMGSAVAHDDIQPWNGFDTELSFPVDDKKKDWIRKSLGTLGSGK